MIILISLFFSLWRSWLGGNFLCKYFNPTRLVKLITLCLLVYISMYYNNYIITCKFRLTAIFMSIVFYWNHSIADYFGVNCTDNDDNKSDVINWILKKLYRGKNYHTFFGNCLGLFIGYTFYSVIIALLINNYYFILSGLLTTLSYAITGKLYPNKDYTSYAEYLSGFLFGLLLNICIV